MKSLPRSPRVVPLIPSIPHSQGPDHQHPRLWPLSALFLPPPLTTLPVTVQQRGRLMTVHCVVSFFPIDCTLVEMCFNQIIARQCVLHWCRYLQPIMFNVEDNRQTTIHQTALACQAPLSRDVFPDPMAREPQLSSTRCVVDSPRHSAPHHQSLYPLCVCAHFFVLFFQSSPVSSLTSGQRQICS